MLIINGRIYTISHALIHSGYVLTKGSKLVETGDMATLKDNFYKDEDIAIFSGNPMGILTRTLYTIIDGKIIYRD